MYGDIPLELRRLIEPVVEGASCELVDASITRGARPWQFRITIDRPEGDGRVSLDRCAEISRELETQLDLVDAIEGAYRLEVSSPGLDRILAREKDFYAACGMEIALETREPLEGRRRFRGELQGFDGSTLQMLQDGQPVRIAFADVAKARTIYNFTREDFASGASAR